ncbi:MAG: TetR/AcrR family transcriptional regulator [Leptolyngbya sp. SIOISBB]|nr:TetR/AcrR family transcriptional regulator [Leptolyngbya sp. SIOISBB]
MVRPKEFDEEEVLQKAMIVFWRKGFRATTPNDLLTAMQISKGSFYSTFGSKRELFLRCLRYYSAQIESQLREFLANPNIRQGLIKISKQVMDSACNEKTGCLIYNSASELSPHDEEVDRIIKNAMKRSEKIYCDRIREGQLSGEISSNRDPLAIARYLITCFAGLGAVGKAGASRKGLEEVVSVSLQILD